MLSKSQILVASAFCLGPLFAQQGAPKGFPQPGPAKDVTITAIPGVIDANAKWTLVWQGNETADGMVGSDDGGLIFAQEQTNKLIKLDKDGKASVFNANTHGPGAISVGPKKQIYVVERTCTDPGGHLGVKPADCTEATDVAMLTPERKILADKVEGKGLGRVNDLIADKKGGIYFTSGGAFYMNPKGEVKPIGENLRTNGITLSPDEKILYITNGNSIVEFDVQPDGSVKNQREFGKLEMNAAGDGLVVDSMGRLYVSTNPGIQVLSPQGKYLGLIPTPRTSITCTFSGPGKKTLYVGTMGAVGPDGQQVVTPPGVRNTAMTVYKIQMVAQGFKGRVK